MDYLTLEITRALKTHANPAKAVHATRFFKTGPGEYGEGDQFWGIPVPTIRKVAKANRDLSLPKVEVLLSAPIHEVRLLGVILLTYQYQAATKEGQALLYQFYIDHISAINNWDLVDISAPTIVGGYLYGKSAAPLVRLAKSDHLWSRRIAIVATYYAIREGDFTTTLKLAEMLLADQEDLIHKAVGWMLREVGKRELAPLRDFLDKHAGHMPRTMLRYAIERFEESLRQYYLAVKATKSR